MKIEELLKKYKNQPVIETRMLVGDTSELPKIRVQLSRWVKSGKLIKVRNGLYMLSDAYTAKSVNVEYVATFACRPSYISLEYALASYGLIPEMVPNLTLVTTKRPKKLRLGKRILIYRHIDKRLFWGYQARGEANFEIFFAEPEKALLDLFYFTSEKVDSVFFEEMRFQNMENIDIERFVQYAALFESPKIERCVKEFCKFIENEGKMKTL